MSASNSISSESTSDEISADNEEDKKFVSQAVAFVISHARNGFVALCASVANLLKEQARLKQEVEFLHNEVAQMRQKNLEIKKNVAKKRAVCTLQKKLSPLTERITKTNQTDTPKKENLLLLQNPVSYKLKSSANYSIRSSSCTNIDVKVSKKPPFKPLYGCICTSCTKENYLSTIKVPLNTGTTVVILGELCGVVHYIGHVDSLDFPEVYVGIEFSEAVGDTDGSFHDKVYFSVRNCYGRFIPLKNILCILK